MPPLISIMRTNFVFLMAGCCWNLDGISKWKQDLWNCEAVDQHPGDMFDIVFAGAAGRAVCQRATEERRAERCKKVSR